MDTYYNIAVGLVRTRPGLTFIRLLLLHQTLGHLPGCLPRGAMIPVRLARRGVDSGPPRGRVADARVVVHAVVSEALSL